MPSVASGAADLIIWRRFSSAARSTAGSEARYSSTVASVVVVESTSVIRSPPIRILANALDPCFLPSRGLDVTVATTRLPNRSHQLSPLLRQAGDEERARESGQNSGADA